MEYIQADIWVRFQRMQDHEVPLLGADDAHGAPIMLAAEKAENPREDFIAEISRGRKRYLDGFPHRARQLHSTHSRENTELSQDIYRKLDKAGLVTASRSSSSSIGEGHVPRRPLHQGRVPVCAQGSVRRRLRRTAARSIRPPS